MSDSDDLFGADTAVLKQRVSALEQAILQEQSFKAGYSDETIGEVSFKSLTSVLEALEEGGEKLEALYK